MSVIPHFKKMGFYLKADVFKEMSSSVLPIKWRL